MTNSFEISLLTLLLAILIVVVGFLVIFFLIKKKYETKITSQYEEAMYKLRSLNEKVEYTDTYYKLKIESIHNEYRIKEESLNDKIQLLKDSKEQMRLEFESLANSIFEKNQRKSDISLDQVLTPFKEQLNQFGKRVNDIYNEETKQRSTLLTQIENLKDLNQQISNDAVNLTKALKGDNKIQGDWGEMILSSILEQTGLRQGVEYTTQDSFTNEEGKRLRPDVIIHLPSKKDIVIDSKVSLKAYVNYVNGENESIKNSAKKELLKSITNHIKGLSTKKYENIKEVRTLDFVLLFIPIEQAFLLASTEDENLFKYAFEHNIMLVSPSTLFVTLRTIENIWRNEHQNENAQLIAKKAANMYDKFAGFVKDMDEIGIHITRTQKSYDNALIKLSSGRGNLLRRSQEFIDLGVKPKNIIDEKSLLEE